MEKIAIKAESWADMKPAVDLLRSVGQTVIKRKDEYLDVDFTILANGLDDKINSVFKGNDWEYLSDGIYLSEFNVLTMPQDMPKLKAALGIDEYKECIEPDQFEGTIKSNGGAVFMIDFSDNEESDIKGYLKTFPESFKPSTKEAYEAQEAYKKKPLKRIILNQYESIEVLVDEFEMVHNNGTLLLLPK